MYLFLLFFFLFQSLEALGPWVGRLRLRSRSTMRVKWTELDTCPRIRASSPPRPPQATCWSLITQSTPPNPVRMTTKKTSVCMFVVSAVYCNIDFIFRWRPFWRVHPRSAVARPPKRRLRPLLEPKPQRLLAQCFWWPCKPPILMYLKFSGYVFGFHLHEVVKCDSY